MKGANDRPTWRPRRVRKSLSSPITLYGGESNEEREKNSRVYDMYQEKTIIAARAKLNS